MENYIAGGSDKLLRLLMEHLPQLRIHLFVNRSNDTSILLAENLPPNIEVVFYDLVTLAELGEHAQKYRGTFGYPFFRFLNALARYPLLLFSIGYFFLKFRRFKADLFLANNGGYPGGEFCRSATIAASLSPDTSVFHLFHNMPTPSRIVFVPAEWLYDKIIDKRCRILCVSNATAIQMKAVRHIRQDIKCIYNGLGPRPLKNYRSDAPLRLLNVGYLGSTKNQAMILRALALAANSGARNIELYLVGKEGEEGYVDSLKKLAVEIGVGGRVHFEGFQNDPSKYYDFCDAFVLSSIVESFPLVILEAMRVGMPVVATQVGGVDEQVENGLNGFFVPLNDVASMAEKFVYFYEHRIEIENFGRQGHAMFNKKFQIGVMLKQYAELFGISNASH